MRGVELSCDRFFVSVLPSSPGGHGTATLLIVWRELVFMVCAISISPGHHSRSQSCKRMDHSSGGQTSTEGLTVHMSACCTITASENIQCLDRVEPTASANQTDMQRHTPSPRQPIPRPEKHLVALECWRSAYPVGHQYAAQHGSI